MDCLCRPTAAAPGFRVRIGRPAFFCELYQRWWRKQDVVLRQEHKAGEKLFVDWAGTTIPIHDPHGGVPYNLMQELVEVRSTPTIIEIFHKSQRVASHLRAHGHGHAVTIAEHRPRSH